MDDYIFSEIRKSLGSLNQSQVDSINNILKTNKQDLLNIFKIKLIGDEMKTSNVGISLIQEFEDLRLNAYDDGVGIWTIGYGTIKYPNGVRVKKGDVCTKEQALEYFKHDLKEFEETVNNKVKVPINQNQFDALVSLSYNIGSGAFSNSTLLKKLNNKDYKGAADQFLVWNKGGGRVLKGLVRRREAERALFLK